MGNVRPSLFPTPPRIFQSIGLTPATWTFTSTSSAFGFGRSISVYSTTPSSPYDLITTALILSLALFLSKYRFSQGAINHDGESPACHVGDSEAVFQHLK